MVIIQANAKKDLLLGRQGENLARQAIFDLSGWTAEYGPGVAELIYQRPGDAAPYPVAAVQENGTLVWTLTATDTAAASSCGSDGHCELRYYVGKTLVKSKTWRTWVEPAMDTPIGEVPPEPEQGWFEQVLAVGAAAKADADRAAALASEVSANAAKTAQDTAAAAQAKESAQTAQRLAEAARSAAEAAQTAAESAQAAAAQSVSDVAAAKQGAEAVLQAAQDAASRAAQALAGLQVLYQEMQTWATGVVQTVNTVSESAGNSAQEAANAAEAARTAQSKAETARKGAEQAQEKAETAAIKQPYPNAETGTWWTWDAGTAAYVDSGEPYEGAALYAAFDIDPATGKLSVYTPARYHGPEFNLNETTGKLEVTVNG